MKAHRASRRRYRNGSFGRSWRLSAFFLFMLPLLSPPSTNLPTVRAYSLGDILGSETDLDSSTTLSLPEISEMRVRDIRRRLTRSHGYGSDEIMAILDKKELINALAYEEHRVRQKEDEARRRFVMRRSIIVALLCVVVAIFFPLFRHVWEVGSINFVVYTDKKRHEAKTCWELKSAWGALGVFCMFVVDTLSLWLSVTVLLSWVMNTKSKYFFPIPSFAVRPAAIMAASTGGNAGALGNYGVNIGPMVVTWMFRFVNGKLELWTGKALVNSQKLRRKQERDRKKAWKRGETQEEKEARRTARASRRNLKESKKQAQMDAAREEVMRVAKEEARARADEASSKINPQQHIDGDSDGSSNEASQLSREERRAAAAAAAEARQEATGWATVEGTTAFDDLD